MAAASKGNGVCAERGTAEVVAAVLCCAAENAVVAADATGVVYHAAVAVVASVRVVAR